MEGKTDREIAEREIVQSNTYDFYHCLGCGRLMTLLEERAAMAEGMGKLCPCGTQKYSPTDLPWYGWFFPRVLKFAWLRWRGLV